MTEPFCPYVGLQPYAEENEPYFAGREREIEIVRDNLYASILTVFYGPTGVGKSSVLRAGVVPAASRDKMCGGVVYFSDWQSLNFRTGLLAHVRRGLRHSSETTSGEAATFDGLIAELGRRAARPVFVILDQFEEYLRYHAQSADGRRFDEELARAVNVGFEARDDDRSASVHFLIGIREDALAALDRYEARIPHLLSNVLRLRPLRAKAARAALIRPLAQYNREGRECSPATIERALVKEVVANARADRATLGEVAGRGRAHFGEEEQPVETAFLQLVMTRVWENEQATRPIRLRLETLNGRLNGVKTIIDTHINHVMSAFGADEQTTAARLFEFLVTPSGAKVAYSSRDLESHTGACVAGVLDGLIRARILRPLGPERVEVMHDLLAPAILAWRRSFLHGVEVELARAQAAADEKHRAEAVAESERIRLEHARIRTEARADQEKLWLQLLAEADKKRNARRGRLAMAVAAAIISALAGFAWIQWRAALRAENDLRRSSTEREAMFVAAKLIEAGKQQGFSDPRGAASLLRAASAALEGCSDVVRKQAKEEADELGVLFVSAKAMDIRVKSAWSVAPSASGLFVNEALASKLQEILSRSLSGTPTSTFNWNGEHLAILDRDKGYGWVTAMDSGDTIGFDMPTGILATFTDGADLTVFSMDYARKLHTNGFARPEVTNGIIKIPDNISKRGIVFDELGRYAAAPNIDNTSLTVWPIFEGKASVQFALNSGQRVIAVASNGTLAELTDKSLHIWTPASTNVHEFSLEGERGPLSFSPDGQLVVTTTGTGAVIRDLSTRPTSIRMDAGTLASNNTWRSMKVSTDGTRVGAIRDDGLVLVWERPSGAIRHRMMLPTTPDFTCFDSTLERIAALVDLKGPVLRIFSLVDSTNLADTPFPHAGALYDVVGALVPELEEAANAVEKGDLALGAEKLRSATSYPGIRFSADPFAEAVGLRVRVLRKWLADPAKTESVREIDAIVDELDKLGPGASLDEPDVHWSGLEAKAVMRIAEAELTANQYVAAAAHYKRADSLDPQLLTAQTWNRLGWWGTLGGHAKDVLFAAQRATTMVPSQNNRDTLALAEALTGDRVKAIEDFAKIVEVSDDYSMPSEQRELRVAWLKELGQGRNPFTPELLASLPP